MNHEIAQLRHLYANMVNGGVKDSAAAKRIAEGLLAPVIEGLERLTHGDNEQIKVEATPVAYMYHDAEDAHSANPMLHSTMLVFACDRRPGYANETPLYTLPKRDELLDTIEAQSEQIESLNKQIEALQADADCFNFWVHEAWHSPGDICRMLMNCETPADYRAKIIPILEARRTAINAASKQGGA